MRGAETPVLIVGGGPVGLALSIDLGSRGVPSILVEQDGAEARKAHPRMDNVGIRSMEFCRRWGIVQAVEHAGYPRDVPISIVYSTGVLGYELARDEYPDKQSARPPAFSPEKHELCPQNFFDPVMQAAASRYPHVDIRYGHRLVEFTQNDDHVEAVVEVAADGRRETIRADYLAACDGAASVVAQQLDIVPSGASVLTCSTNIFIRCPDLARLTAGRRAYRHVLIDSGGIWATIVNIDGRDIWRLQVVGDSTWPEWTADQIDELVRRGIGGDVPFEVLSWLPWSRREYVAERFSMGRCFLVGDAAHQLSPTGGYGMNTGIAEAVDLSWKLAAVIEGWGGGSLLDSYEAERRPIAQRNVRQASENLAAMRGVPSDPRLFDEGPEADEVRRLVGLTAQKIMRREWRSFGIHLGAIYRNSPIVVDNGRELVEDDIAQFVQRAQPGARAPHVWLDDGTSTLDLFGNGFVLLDFGQDGRGVERLIEGATRRGVPLRHVRLDNAEAKALYGEQYVLVRPDGHIAWLGDAIEDNALELIDRVRGAGIGRVKAAA